MPNKVDANFTGLRYAMEVIGQPGVLPGEAGNQGSPVFKELEPNSYSDFGSELKTTARSPITAGRQKKKGRVTDLDAKAGFQLDFTGNNLVDPLSTFMFAEWRAAPQIGQIEATNAGSKTYTRSAGFGAAKYPVGGLVLAEHFPTVTNNGLKTLTASDANSITVAETVVAETDLETGSLTGWTLSLTIDADADNGFVSDRTVEYTFAAAETIADAGPALVALLAAQTPVITATYTSGTGVLQIDAGENCGMSTITSVVTDSEGVDRPASYATIEAAAGTANDTRDITLTTVVAPDYMADATVHLVGFKSVAGDIDVDASVALRPKWTSSALDFTTLPLVPGKWIYIGGDASATRLTNAGNNGYARVHSVAAHEVVFDKTQNAMITEVNTTKTVAFFFGDFIRNEDDPDLIVTKSMQLERYVVVGYEYAKGCFGNELTINLPTADKITIDLSFLSLDTQAVETADRKPGVFPTILTDAAAFNTSSDMIRIRASAQASAAPLFGFVQEASLKVANNVSTLKALGILGAFDVAIGDFEVTGDMTAYFSDIAAVQAVRASTSLSLDFILAFDNRGWVFDVPLFTGDKGTLAVEKDKAITIPVGVNAAEDDDYHATLLITWFPYLPNIATPQV